MLLENVWIIYRSNSHIAKNKSIDCENYRLVKTYNSFNEYENDTNNFVDSEYSKLNYLVEYSDLIGILNNEDHIYNNTLYQLNSLVILDNDGKNKLNVKNEISSSYEKFPYTKTYDCSSNFAPVTLFDIKDMKNLV